MMRLYFKAIFLLSALLFTATAISQEQPAEPSDAVEKNNDAPESDAEKPEENPPEEETQPPATEDQTLDVWADQIIYEGDTFNCTGNVVITRSDAKIVCDEVEGVISEIEREDSETGEKKNERTISSLVATGSPIIMTTEKQKATCLRAEYDLPAATITLTGSEEDPPTLTEGARESIQGERIVYHIDKNKWVIERSRIHIPIEDDKLPDILK